MNIDLIKKNCLEDVQKRLNYIAHHVELLSHEKTGLFKKILNTDRGLLFKYLGTVIDISPMDHNRDELTFMESLIHFFNYYMYDDGESCIKWHRFNIDDGVYIDCKQGDNGAKPYLTIIQSGDDIGKCREDEIFWLIEWAEKDRRPNEVLTDNFIDYN